jgi:hypothetical protein
MREVKCHYPSHYPRIRDPPSFLLLRQKLDRRHNDIPALMNRLSGWIMELWQGGTGAVANGELGLAT